MCVYVLCVCVCVRARVCVCGSLETTRSQRRPENHAVLHRVGTSTTAGWCSQRLMEWKCVSRGFSRQQKVPLLALQTEIDHRSSSKPCTVVFGCFQPSSTTPPGLVRLRNGRPYTATNGQAPNKPPVQGKTGVRLATSPIKDWHQAGPRLLGLGPA